jgi:hypothetical protein
MRKVKCVGVTPNSVQAVYPKYDCQSKCQQDIERLDEMCRQKKFGPSPPSSLLYACEEFRRFQLHH